MKYAWIEAQAGRQPIARLCKVLSVSRSGFLQWRDRGPSDREVANQSLDAQVAVIHAEGKQGYGRIRVTRPLRQSGMRIGAERVRKSLVRQHLRTVYRRPYRVTTDSNHKKTGGTEPVRSALYRLVTQPSVDGRHHLLAHR